MDGAVKLCKTATGRDEVIAFQGAFHGSTPSTIALSGLRAPKERLRNLNPGVSFFPFSYCLRCPLGLEPATCSTNYGQFLTKVLTDPNGGVRRPAAAIIELVQGEGGVIPARAGFVRELRETTSRLDIPLIVDEVQSGVRRTGTWFASSSTASSPTSWSPRRRSAGVTRRP